MLTKAHKIQYIKDYCTREGLPQNAIDVLVQYEWEITKTVDKHPALILAPVLFATINAVHISLEDYCKEWDTFGVHDAVMAGKTTNSIDNLQAMPRFIRESTTHPLQVIQNNFEEVQDCITKWSRTMPMSKHYSINVDTYKVTYEDTYTLSIENKGSVFAITLYKGNDITNYLIGFNTDKEIIFNDGILMGMEGPVLINIKNFLL